MPIAIAATGLVKRYAGVAALDGVDLRVAASTVHALLGPNSSSSPPSSRS